jgi:hypothetical protein
MHSWGIRGDLLNPDGVGTPDPFQNFLSGLRRFCVATGVGEAVNGYKPYETQQ